ncbi:hypothetical protein [Paenibacillus hemerocallicola]|nr:hypothetical protein [Paenibacillus hemerocallicola]
MSNHLLFATDSYMFHLHEQTPREFDYTRAAADGNWHDWQRAFRK